MATVTVTLTASRTFDGRILIASGPADPADEPVCTVYERVSCP